MGDSSGNENRIALNGPPFGSVQFRFLNAEQFGTVLVRVYSAARPAEPIYSEDQRRKDERRNGIIVSGGGLL